MLLKNLEKELEQFGNNSTIHGISHIFNSPKSLVKVIWTFIFLLCFSFSLVLLSQTIINYLSYKTSSKLAVKIHNEIDFPAVTICNRNYYDLTVKNFPVEMSNEIRNFIKLFNKNFVDYADKLFSTDFSSFYETGINYIKSVQFKYNLTNSERLSLNKDISDMLLSCQFNSQNCSYKDFFQLWNSFNGRCFRFNSGKNQLEENIVIKKMKNGGSRYGLRLELFLGEPYGLQKSSGLK